MITKLASALGATQVLSSSGSAATSTALTGITKVRVATTTAIYIAIGSNPTATTSDFILGIDGVEQFSITPGHKVSVLQVSAPGKVSVTPVY